MDLGAALAEQDRAWNERPLVRRQYGEWYQAIVDSLADVPGPTVELGSGIGKLKDFKPDAVTTDVEVTPWADVVVDAEALPYADGEVANLVLLDVFHHLADPARFLDEARRVLSRGGRVVIVDPYCSPFSTPIYKRFHHERTDLSVQAFERDQRTSAAPLESNQARATFSTATARVTVGAGLSSRSCLIGASRSSSIRSRAASHARHSYRRGSTHRCAALSARSSRWRQCSRSAVWSYSSAASCVSYARRWKRATRNFRKANTVIRRSSSPWRKRLMFVVP